MTTEELAEYAMREDAVAVLPIGSIEEHGPHLPLGTDALIPYKIACMVAEKEPAVVLPTVAYSFVTRQKTFPGTMTLHANVLLELLENICDEISRTGIKKIILFNHHGGNEALLETFCRSLLDKEKNYIVFRICAIGDLTKDVRDEVIETEEDEHAGEVETSEMLYLFPELVRRERMRKPRPPVKFDIGCAEVVAGWGVEVPDGIIGNPLKASEEKGERLVEAMVRGLAFTIGEIKKAKVELQHQT